MEQLTKAKLMVEWQSRQTEWIDLKINPTELTFDKGVQIAEVALPGLDSPLQQFIRGQAEKLTLDLFFDTTDCGMGDDATSVTTQTDRIYQLLKIEPSRHAPPIVTLVWGAWFPGSTLGRPPSDKPCDGRDLASSLSQALATAGTAGDVLSTLADFFGSGAKNEAQRRNGFRGIVESVKQKFTLFSPKGVPLRATLTVMLREYKTLKEQLQQLNLMSPDLTHSHVVQQGETLSSIAGQMYNRPGQWRAIADANAIEDPRRLVAGAMLAVPPIRK